jgi:drug/metabolite transporter (DMT)-like permease
MLAAMVLSGTIGVFVVESGQSALNVVFFRCLFGAISLALYCWYRGMLKRSAFHWKAVLLAMFGGVCIVFNWVFLFQSYSLTSITVGTVVYHMQPFFVLLLSAVLFRTPIGAHKLGWVVLSFGGLILITEIYSTSVAWESSYLLGVGSALLAAFLYAIATIVAKQIKDFSPHLTAFTQTSFGILLLLPFADLQLVPLQGNHWYFLISLGVIHTCVLYIFLYSAFKKLSYSMIAVLVFVYPVVAIIADNVVYGKKIGVPQLLGIALIFISGLGVTQGWRFVPTFKTRFSNSKGNEIK